LGEVIGRSVLEVSWESTDQKEREKKGSKENYHSDVARHIRSPDAARHQRTRDTPSSKRL